MNKSKTNENELNNQIVNEEDEIVAYVVSADTLEITDSFRYGDSYKKKTKEDKKKILEFLVQEDECTFHYQISKTRIISRLYFAYQWKSQR